MNEYEDLLKYWFSKTIIRIEGKVIIQELLEKALEAFSSDYKRYYPEQEIDINQLTRNIPLQGILCYRIARQYYLNDNAEIAEYYSNLGRYLSGFEIYYSANIGHALKINHGIGTIIGARCNIGDNLLIHQNVTIGDKNGLRPQIGNNVTIYAGAKILGGIKIEDNALIGANAVVFINVPENKKAVGIPARIID